MKYLFNKLNAHYKRTILYAAVLAFLACFLLPDLASAHNYSASFTQLSFNKKSTKMTFSIDTLSVIELVSGADRNKNYILSKSEVKKSEHKIEEVILESLALDKGDKEQTPHLDKMEIIKKQNKEYVSFHLTFPVFKPGDTVSLADGLYAGNSGTTNYVNLLSVKYGSETSEAALQGSNRTWTMLLTEDQQEQQSDQQQSNAGKTDLNGQHAAVKTPSKANHQTSAWLSFFKLGIFHILTGYDHLLFLFALLISRQTLKQYIGTVTAFTLAHSITLTLAVMGVVDIPSKIVESIIALSICYVALENIFRKNITYRWVITFLFGLIHGLGFASILKDMNLPKSDLAVALISFNLGIECIQLLIVLILVPILLKWQKAFKYPTYLKIGSSCIFALGLIWLIQRIIA
ncbi:HupE/UreJ family protein [Actinomycetes bacterium NPDC127524]